MNRSKTDVTKRELLAAMVLQGLLADRENIICVMEAADLCNSVMDFKQSHIEIIAFHAVEYADALLKELEKVQQ